MVPASTQPPLLGYSWGLQCNYQGKCYHEGGTGLDGVDVLGALAAPESTAAPAVPLALVIEDDDRIIAVQLRAEGFKVMRAATAEEGLVRAAKSRPQLIDALRSRRPCKEAFSHERTVEIITVGDGRTLPAHFDPAVLNAFTGCIGRFRDIFEAHRDEG